MPKLDTMTLDAMLSAVYRAGRPATEIGGLISDGATPYTVQDLADAFATLRRTMQRLIAGMSSAQLDWSPDANTFSLSEIFSHVAMAQNLTYNLLLDNAASDLPHIDPVPRSAGGGSERSVPLAELQARLTKATEMLTGLIQTVIVSAEGSTRLSRHPLFGNMTAKGALLFQLGHDLDHLKQAQLLRRMPGFPSGGRPPLA
jgi:hypothetical protein